MPLPILRVEDKPSDAVLSRYFFQTQRVWNSQIAEAEHLEFGTAYSNPELPRVWEANCIHDASVPAGMSVDDVIASASAHYASKGVRGRMWVLNASAPAEETQPLLEYFAGRHFRTLSSEILHLKGSITLPDEPRKDLTVIPARASFRHMEMLAAESAKKWDEPQLIAAEMLHLDDPHWDCLLALKEGVPVATIGVLACGDIGRIENVFVTESQRGKGVGRTMMTRAMEICARSLFKHVFLSVFADNQPAKKLYGGFGFAKVGDFVSYVEPE